MIKYENEVAMHGKTYFLALIIVLIVSCENKNNSLEKGLLVHYIPQK